MAVKPMKMLICFYNLQEGREPGAHGGQTDENAVCCVFRSKICLVMKIRFSLVSYIASIEFDS